MFKYIRVHRFPGVSERYRSNTFLFKKVSQKKRYIVMTFKWRQELTQKNKSNGQSK